MKIYTTTDYFGLTFDEAAKVIDECGMTREEAKVLDTGYEQHFYESHDFMMQQYYSDFYQNRIKENDYDVRMFRLVADNTNHNRYCMCLGYNL